MSAPWSNKRWRDLRFLDTEISVSLQSASYLGSGLMITYNLLLEYEQDALLWAESCHVSRDIRHGNTSFNGNSCKVLLEKIYFLRSRCQNVSCLMYVEAFKALRDVVGACFGQKLDPSP